MPAAREIARRIKSVKSTRKITKAMQMVSAAKMRKSQTANTTARTYSTEAWHLLDRLNSGNLHHPLLTSFPESKKVCVVLIASNRGLVGSFNANLIGELFRLKRASESLVFDLVVLGKKAREGVIRLKMDLLADFPKVDAVPTYESIYPLAQFLTEQYMSGKYREVIVIYNQCISTLIQKVNHRRLFPLAPRPATHAQDGEGDAADEQVYEPTPQELVKQLLPRIIESQLYQAILESDASEHSARMVMMKNATEAAGELVDDLTLTYNQIRQNKITTELSEITAGKLALENKS
jgi:F-type H+-transporting ATPase subunit gamma